MKNEKGMWASIINDARFYDGTPQMLTQLTEHFMNYYVVTQKLKHPDIIKSVCDHVSPINGMVCIGGRCSKCNEIV